MKRILLLIAIFMVAVATLMAQVPQGMKYQAVARDDSGNILADQSIALKVELLSGDGFQ